MPNIPLSVCEACHVELNFTRVPMSHQLLHLTVVPSYCLILVSNDKIVVL